MASGLTGFIVARRCATWFLTVSERQQRISAADWGAMWASTKAMFWGRSRPIIETTSPASRDSSHLKRFAAAMSPSGIGGSHGLRHASDSGR